MNSQFDINQTRSPGQGSRTVRGPFRRWMSDVGCWMFFHSAVAILILVSTVAVGAQEKEKEKEKKPEEKITVNFEGAADAGVNWVELSMGSLFPTGNRAQAEQMRRVHRPIFGGIEDLHYQTEVATNTMFTLDGRGLYDNHDYKLMLGLKKEDTYFLRLNFENFRTYYNGDGGFHPPTGTSFPYSRDALGLDRGEISLEGGLIFKDKPAVTFKYTHLYREGDKSSTIWGQTHPQLIFPSVGLTPTTHVIDEQRDILELNVKHHYKLTDFGGGVRYELGGQNNALKISQYPGEPPVGGVPQDRRITDRQEASYDMFSAHAFSETWFKPNLMFSAGFMYTTLNNDFSGNRTYGSDFDVAYTPNPGNGAGYLGLDGSSHQQDYVLNANLFAIPFKNWTIVPSLRVQREDWNSDAQTFLTLGNTLTGPLTSDGDGDRLEVRERIDVRYTGFTNWVLYGLSEWTEGRGNLDESGGIYLGSPIQRETSDTRFFQKYGLGAKWYPMKRVSVDFGGYYKNHDYDYDHETDNTPNNSGNAYPAYLVMQNFETFDGYARLTFRPLANLTLVSRYEYQLSTIHTTPDAISGLSEVESARMTSHILAQNVSWSPWSRLYLQAGFNYVLSETKTPTASYAQSVLNAQNNYWTANLNAGFALDKKTDLNLGYSYYRANNYEDNSAFGVPYGAGADQHGVTATLSRWLNNKVRLTVRYGFYRYRDETFGGNYDYDAHVLFSSLEYRF